MSHYVGNSFSGIKVDSPEALASALRDPERAAEIFGNARDAEKFRAAYSREIMADGSMRREIAEQTQDVLSDFLRGSRVPGGKAIGMASAQAAARHSYDAPGAKADGIFSSVADMFGAVSWRAKHDARAQAKLAKVAEIQNSFGSEVPDAGGFLVPETLRSEILMASLETAIVRPRATVIPMSTLRVPIPMIDDTTHASNVYGGIQFYWTEEAAAITESQASFGRVVLDAKKLAGYFAVPNELLQDAPAFAAFLQRVLPGALSWFEDVAFLNGTGTGEPMGLVNCAASVSVTTQPGQQTKTILYENLCSMWAQLLPQCQRNAVWIANVNTFPELATIALSVGTGGGPVWIGGSATTAGTSAAEAPPSSIFGRPIYFTEKLPTLGTSGDIILCDPSFYLVGDRMQMEISSSEHYLFANDKTAFRLLERVDGQPWLQSSITPHNGTNALSAFVQIVSR